MADNPSRELPSPHDEALVREAWALCTQAHERPHDATMQSRIGDWRGLSPDHEACWQEVNSQWQAAGAIVRQRDTLLSRLRVAVALRVERAGDYGPGILTPVAWTACLLLVALILPWLVAQYDEPSAPVAAAPASAAEPEPALFSTERASRTVVLEDGSQLMLNWRSSVRVSYSPYAREIELLQGEAYFDVMPDASRSFIVSVDSMQARAVGTAFSVRKEGDAAVRVVVSEGVVQVSAGGEQAQLEVNQQVRMMATGVAEPRPVDADAQSAWRDGLLVFEERPLREVLGELGRYTGIDLNLAALPGPERAVTATYFIDRADAALALIADAFNLQLGEAADPYP